MSWPRKRPGCLATAASCWCRWKALICSSTSAGGRTSSSAPKNSTNAALSCRICSQPRRTFSGLRKTSPGCLTASSSAACATRVASDLRWAIITPETSHAPVTGPRGTSRACRNPPLGNRPKAARPMFEYVRYSKSSSRFSRIIASWSVPRISNSPSTGSCQPSSISRSASVRSGRLAKNRSTTVLPSCRRCCRANRSTRPITSPSSSSPSGPVTSRRAAVSDRSKRGPCANRTRSRFNSALRSMSWASSWFMPHSRRGNRCVYKGPYCPGGIRGRNGREPGWLSPRRQTADRLSAQARVAPGPGHSAAEPHRVASTALLAEPSTELNRRAGRDAQHDPLSGLEPLDCEAVVMASRDIVAG